MILRIVKMHFKTEEVAGFLEFFETVKHKIEAMPGLVNLRLYQDQSNEQLVFTLSSWLDQNHLDNYRNSELFAEVWPRTKASFAERPEAWSLKLK